MRHDNSHEEEAAGSGPATLADRPGANDTMSVSRYSTCACGKNRIELTFREGMPTEVVDRVLCPTCRQGGFKNGESFPIPGGWYLHFNLEVARMFAMARLYIDPSLVNPGFIIDGRYVE